MSKSAISQNNISPEIMNTTQVSKNGISIYNIKKDRMIHYKNPYGTAAKRAYVQLIDSGINPEFILSPYSGPDDQTHSPYGFSILWKV